MTDGVLNRRQFLESLTATVVVASAGCLDLGGDDAYTDWIPANPDGLVFASLDVGVTQETDEDDILAPVVFPAGTGDEQPVRVPPDEFSGGQDPLFNLPLETGGAILAGAAIAFWATGLGHLIDIEQSPSADEILLINGGVAATGEFDTDRVDETLRTGGDTAVATAYERVDRTDQFTFYEPIEDTDAGNAPGVVAVSGERILVDDDRAGIERLVETADGDRPRAVDELAGFDWLTETVDDGHVVAGWYGSVSHRDLPGNSDSDRLHDVFGPDDDVVVSVTLAPAEDELTVDLAVRSDSFSTDRQETLETQLGTASREHSVAVDGNRLSASGTYEDITFEPVDPGEDETDNLPSGDDLPAEVAEAVPDGAIEFSRRPDREGAVRVELVETIEADEISVHATNADAEISTETPREGMTLTIFADPEGDEIRVVATVDGVSGIVASAEFP